MMKLKLKVRQYLKMAAQNLYLPAVYHIYRHRRIEPDLVIFADAHHEQRPESMELLYQALTARGVKIEEMYLDYQKAGTRKVIRHMTAFMRRYAQAKTVVICDNFLPAASCRKRRETDLVQLWHACGALKRFGYDTTEDIPGSYRGNVFRGTDLVTVSAPYCVRPFARAMHLPKGAVQAMGVSRTDRYFDAAYLEACRRKAAAAWPEAQGRKLVLWAPTFRGSPGAPQLINLDPAKLQAQLGEEYLVISSLHPHMQDRQEYKAQTPSTQELLPAVDVLVADYSSLIFEYMLLGKPLVLYTPDYETYVQKRGFYMPFEEIPGLQVKNEDELAGAIVRAAAQGCDERARKKFLRRYMSACDAHATERIADWILR